MQLLTSGKQRAGKASRILINSSGVPGTLTFASWSYTVTAEDYQTVNLESFITADLESYTEGLHGPLDCAAQAGGDWDAGNAFFSPGFPAAGAASVPGLYPRDDLGNGIAGAGNGVQFVVNRIDGTVAQFPWFRVRSATNSTDARGKVGFNWSGNNQGRFFLPVTSV